MRSIVQLALVAALLLGGGWYLRQGGLGGVADPGPGAAAGALPAGGPPTTAADPAREAFEEGAQGRQIAVRGTVQRLLADDNRGSRHQRFIIGTDSGQSLLVAHNIDLAPRLDGLAVGEVVQVFGEYEWNDQGGVMHWTHHDPQGRHVTGYIEWRGRRYQ